jgi:hypothetical protein
MEGAQAKMLILVPTKTATGAKLGQNIIFHPRNALRIPKVLPPGGFGGNLGRVAVS